MAKIYAEHYGLIPFAGSDNHSGANRELLAGMCCDEPVCDVADFIDQVKSGKAQILTLKNV